MHLEKKFNIPFSHPIILYVLCLIYYNMPCMIVVFAAVSLLISSRVLKFKGFCSKKDEETSGNVTKEI